MQYTFLTFDLSTNTLPFIALQSAYTFVWHIMLPVGLNIWSRCTQCEHTWSNF